jgi:nickel/cobalt transporter (NiCoT) family protein
MSSPAKSGVATASSSIPAEKQLMPRPETASPDRSLVRLSGSERGRLAGMALVVLLLNGVGWSIFVFAIAPHHFHFKGLGLGIGVAVTAWTLGVRHAFDADHISAIDNTTRKLMADGKRPLATGFFFALGHSSIIVAVGVGLSLAARAVFGAVVDPNSGYETLGGVIGTSMAAFFLYLIAALNLVVLGGILKVFRGMRQGDFDEEELERQLQSRGLMYRFFGRFMRSITKTWHMFPVGVVFGIGFDTATEVLLLSATAAAATEGLPWYAVLSLPLLFAGGMTLFDTLDGCFMNFAYGWAFARPVRKVYYNLVITGLSIAVAFLIGTIEVFGLLSTELHIHGGFWNFMANFDINKAGFAIAALFIVVWAIAVTYWKVAKVETRWMPAARPDRQVAGSLLDG